MISTFNGFFINIISSFVSSSVFQFFIYIFAFFILLFAIRFMFSLFR